MAAKAVTPYPTKDLYACGPQATYTGRNLDEIAFPLGGLGTGTVYLGGWGQLRDWEIFNRPHRGNIIPNAYFTLRVQQGKQAPVVKMVQGPAGGAFSESGHSALRQDTGAGLPHFRHVSFTGEYPFATVRMKDPDIPVEVKLEAFNPFIPLNDKDSSIPVAILRYTLKNRSKQTVTAALLGSMTNVIGDDDGRVNEARTAGGVTGLFLTTSKLSADAPRFGSMVVATTWEDAFVWARWKSSESATSGVSNTANLAKFWEHVAWSKQLPEAMDGDTGTGSVGAKVTLKPGQSVTIPFVIAWSFPNFEHWRQDSGPDGTSAAVWKNYYATQWADAWEEATYTAENLARLLKETRRFHDTLFATTLPSYVLDAVSSQISILKTPTCLRLTDGTFYGFEGCSNRVGCCEGSCTHVWNYAQALPYLFPPLQRGMRDAEYANSLLDDGYMVFRMPLPLGKKGEPDFHPAADGQMGTVIQVYRDWLISGDREWLQRIWPATKKALEFAWKYWDADKDGVMEGMQHNTYDIEFHGPNTMMGSLYLAALESAARIADELGEGVTAKQYRALAAKGSAWTDKNLFNGEYYEQKVNPKARNGWPEQQVNHSLASGLDDKYTSWPRWQYGRGCISDQLIGQWYADMVGLAPVYKQSNIRKALASIFRYNWKKDLTNHPCLLRIYGLNEEAGLLVGSWPKGERPGHGFYFADELWCGIEYQAAAGMIYQGLVDEGLTVVKGTRARHTGERRNPWDEYECGHYYARSMAAYSVLTALSGFAYSAPEQRIGFAPRLFAKDFRTFFSVGSGWGSYGQKLTNRRADLTLSVKYGVLTLKTLTAAVSASKVTATLGGRALSAQLKKVKGGTAVVFDAPVTIKEGQTLNVALRA